MRSTNKRNTVLIADDDLFVRKVISSALNIMSTIIECTDGEQVLPMYTRHTPDILFLDIHLPNQSGLDIIAKIKEVDAQAYIIMLSADSSMRNVKTAHSNGASGFLTKPFEKKRILHYFHNCPTVSFTDC